MAKLYEDIKKIISESSKEDLEKDYEDIMNKLKELKNCPTCSNVWKKRKNKHLK